MMLLQAEPAGLDVALWKRIALLVFFGIFLVVALRLLWTRAERYDDVSRIPLDDDQVVTPRVPNASGRTEEGAENG